jgi:hypothetical protein
MALHFTWRGKEFMHNFGGCGGGVASGKLLIGRQAKYRRII